MLTLSPYLATYFGIGATLAFWFFAAKKDARAFQAEHLATAGKPAGLFGCAAAVLMTMALWPVVVLVGVFEAIRSRN